MRHIKVCLLETATDDEVATLIKWLEGVRCTGAVFEVREIRHTPRAADFALCTCTTRPTPNTLQIDPACPLHLQSR